jgi:parvulin-like peptidyl-prolyl isomerase
MTPAARRAWLIAGALTGCLLSAIQILHDARIPMGFLPGVAARVNGREIDAASVDRTVAGLDARLQSSEPAARRRVVSRMIDEELLVQHALDGGAAETDPEVRAALVRAAITRVNSEVSSQSVSEPEIGAFYQLHRGAYASPAEFQVTPLYFESRAFPNMEEARRRADSARAGVRAGQAVESLQRAADVLPFGPPAQLATARTLANYFGSPLADELDRLQAGEATEPAAFGHGVLLLYLNRRVDGATPNLPSVHDLVQADALRDKQEAALEDLLASLRKSARIDIPPDTHLGPPSTPSGPKN